MTFSILYNVNSENHNEQYSKLPWWEEGLGSHDLMPIELSL